MCLATCSKSKVSTQVIGVKDVELIVVGLVLFTVTVKKMHIISSSNLSLNLLLKTNE